MNKLCLLSAFKRYNPALLYEIFTLKNCFEGFKMIPVYIIIQLELLLNNLVVATCIFADDTHVFKQQT